jgi:hypothetical protein
MTTLELKYNSFTVETGFFIDGKESSLNCFGTGKGYRLRDYIADFFPEAMKKCWLGPNSECTVQFYGTQSDFEDVLYSYTEYQKQNEGIKIELPPCKRYPQSLNEIREYANNKNTEYDTEIIVKKTEIKKIISSIAEKAKLETDNLLVIYYELEKEAEKYDKIIENIFQEKLATFADDMTKLRQKKIELLDATTLRKISYDKKTHYDQITVKLDVIIATSKILADYIKDFLLESNKLFISSCKYFLSVFSIIDNDIAINELPEIECPRQISPTLCEKTPRTNQEASDRMESMFNDAKAFSKKSLLTQRNHYSGELEAASATITKKTTKRRESLKSRMDMFSFNSEDKISLEKAIYQLEAKKECLEELSIEINRLQGDLK